jgi:hypothetical protein
LSYYELSEDIYIWELLHDQSIQGRSVGQRS